jgi:hypothetical protein
MLIKYLRQGKIYFVSYGENTQLVFRFKKDTCTQFYYYDALHYWNGFESFYKNEGYCVHSNISELRPATKPEKHLLLRFEIEHDCI